MAGLGLYQGIRSCSDASSSSCSMQSLMEPPNLEAGSGPLALLLSGGGARGAYQVGVLRSLAKSHPDLEIPILTGVSAGGINIAFLAAGRSGFRDCVGKLTDLWLGLSPEKVFRVGLGSLGWGVLRWLVRLGLGGSSLAPEVRGLVDTTPLRDLLTRALVGSSGNADTAIPGIEDNLAEGLRAVGISTVDYATGKTTIWCQGAEIEAWERPFRRSVPCELTVNHIMASSALPLFFPAVHLEDRWHGDGGIRLTSPLAPAIHLGARRIIAVSTRSRRAKTEAHVEGPHSYPSPAQVAGVLLNSVFLDLLDQDALHLRRINRLLEKTGDQAADGLEPIDLLLLRPSQDLGALAGRYEARLPKGFRFLTRGLGSRDDKGSDLISMLMFQRDYIERLIEIGEADGDAQSDELDRILSTVGP